MKVETSQITQVRLTNVGNRLSNIDVMLEDHKPNHGEIIIKCDGNSWTYYWNGMGSPENPRTLKEFFCSCDNFYLVNKLGSGISGSVYDFYELEDHLKNEIIKQRMSLDLDRHEARDLWEDVRWAGSWNHYDINQVTDEQSRIMTEIIGDEWWYDLPETTNPEYTYLSNIVSAVREGLQKLDYNLAPV